MTLVRINIKKNPGMLSLSRLIAQCLSQSVECYNTRQWRKRTQRHIQFKRNSDSRFESLLITFYCKFSFHSLVLPLNAYRQQIFTIQREPGTSSYVLLSHICHRFILLRLGKLLAIALAYTLNPTEIHEWQRNLQLITPKIELLRQIIRNTPRDSCCAK